MEREKDIADLQRQLAALAGDNSASARAKRAQLEAELAEAEAELQDKYYERSVQNQQDALDQELEAFKEEKEAEMEGWDEYLENTELVVADSLQTVQDNTEAVYNTLQQMGEEYSLSISEAIVDPWANGESAIQSYSETFGITVSSTIEELQELKKEWESLNQLIDLTADTQSTVIESNANEYIEANNPTPSTPTTTPTPTPEPTPAPQEKAIVVGGKINASGAKIYSQVGGTGYNQYYASDPIYTVLGEDGDYWKVRHHSLSSGVTGWFKKGTVKAYAKGTTGVDANQWAWIDELGDELVLRAGENGKLTYLTKGSSVIPHDISENLMQLGQLDPSKFLEQNRPAIDLSPSVVNNTTEINLNIAEVIHIDEVTNDTIPDLTKAVEKQMDAYMSKLNNAIKAKVR